MRVPRILALLLVCSQAWAQANDDVAKSQTLELRAAIARFVGSDGADPAREELTLRVREGIASGNADVRALAIEGAVWLEPEGGEYLDPVARLLQDDNVSVRVEAAKAMGTLGLNAATVADDLEEMLDDPNTLVQQEAAIALSGIRPSPECVSVLSAVLPDAYFTYVPRITEALARMRDVSEPSLDAWMDALENEDRFNREKPVSTAIARFGELAVPRLIEALESGERNAPVNATFALGKIGAAGEAAIPALESLLGSDDAWLACHAAMALSEMGHRTDTVVNALIGFLGKERVVIEVLAKHGPVAIAPVCEAIDKAVAGGIVSGESEGAYGRKRIVINGLNVLEEIGPPAAEATGQIIEFLLGDDLVLTRHAVFALSAIAPTNADVQEAMRVALADEDGVVRLRAAGTLLHSPEHVDQALPIVLKALQEPGDGDRRSVAAEHLQHMSRKDDEALALLRASLSDVDVRVRLNASEALWRVAEDAQATVTVLARICAPEAPLTIEYLDGGTPRRTTMTSAPSVQTRSAGLLGEMGAAAIDALPALESATRASAPDLRQAACEAISRILLSR